MLALLGACAPVLAQGPAQAQVVVAAGPGSTGGNWLAASMVQTRVVVGSDGQTYVGIWIDPPAGQVAAARAPLDLALVLDNSGSMAGERIVAARLAAVSLLENLHEGDIVSVYAFASDVREVAPPTVVSQQSRASLIERVNTIEPMGGTNLFAGLQVGEARVAQAPASHSVRRVIVISDGQANIGPSSPQELGALAAQGTEHGAQVSAIGVGLDYDERTLGALAMSSAGRLYHLQQTSQMADILRQELQLLQTSVAADATIELEPAPGIQFLGAEMAQGAVENGRLRVRLGSLYGGQHREVLVRAHVATDAVGTHRLGVARLAWRDPSANAPRQASTNLDYEVTSDARAASASTNGRVNAMVANFQAAQSQLRASEALNRGDSRGAEVALASAERDLQNAIAAAPAAVQQRMQAQVRRIQSNRVSVGAASGGAAAPSARPSRAGALRINADAYSDLGM